MKPNEWKNPENKYKLNLIIHNWQKNVEKELEAIQAYGFYGVVTNVPFSEGFTSNMENLNNFSEILKKIKAIDSEYWIYDENGYPSGQANGMTLKDREDLSAKGIYMRKFSAYDRSYDFEYTIDGFSDEIAFACVYKQDLSKMGTTTLLLDTCASVPFSKTTTRVKIEAGEVCYIFIVKNAYEGSHCVHNVCSRRKYINLLSREATSRFVEAAFKPISKNVSHAYLECRAVFTDEPSLMVAYATDTEVFNYALAPYEKSLFDEFLAEYGYDLRPLLPLVYEETNNKYRQVRVDFYRLIGKLISVNYTQQINDYLKSQGTMLSGHYLGEERVLDHVIHYGDYVRVLCESGYPGMDILQCTPEDFPFNAPLFLQYISRKCGTNGYMVELCPFFNLEVFNKNPYENIFGTLSLLYMFGARKINSYFKPDYRNYSEELKDSDKGKMNLEQSVYLNNYVARIAKMLEGKMPISHNFVYYAIEDVQSKLAPKNTGYFLRDSKIIKLDTCLKELAEGMLRHGESYVFVDKNDLSGDMCKRKRVIIPDTDYIYEDTVFALKTLFDCGTDIVFIGKKPVTIEKGEQIDFGRVVLCSEFLTEVSTQASGKLPDNVFSVDYEDNITMLYNNNFETVSVTLKDDCRLCDADNGEISELKKGDSINNKSYRALFLLK